MGKTTLGEQAYLALKERVAQLDSGTHLSVRSFAKELGMSYTPVREAFLRLEQEGTLKQIPNVGFFIQTYDITAVIHYYQVRECLEPFVLRNVFEQLTPADIGEMETCLQKSAEAMRQDDFNRYIDWDIAFHQTIFNRYANPHLSSLYHAIREQNMYCSKGNRTISSYAINDHTMLLQAIRDGDCRRAVDILSDHITHAKAHMRDGYVQFLK